MPPCPIASANQRPQTDLSTSLYDALPAFCPSLPLDEDLPAAILALFAEHSVDQLALEILPFPLYPEPLHAMESLQRCDGMLLVQESALEACLPLNECALLTAHDLNVIQQPMLMLQLLTSSKHLLQQGVLHLVPIIPLDRMKVPPKAHTVSEATEQRLRFRHQPLDLQHTRRSSQGLPKGRVYLEQLYASSQLVVFDHIPTVYRKQAVIPALVLLFLH